MIVLSKDNPTFDFKFTGDCYICATGNGILSIERRVGNEFVVMTNDRGEQLVFASDNVGVIYNSYINCKKPLMHRLVASTDSEIKIDISKERL